MRKAKCRINIFQLYAELTPLTALLILLLLWGEAATLRAETVLPKLSLRTQHGREVAKTGADLAFLTHGFTSDATAEGDLVKISLRGNSSKNFAKKQYEIEFINAKNEVIETSLFGLPKAEKWVLYGPYVDRSLLRNSFIYELGRAIGKDRGEAWFAPRTQFVELNFNHDYRGVYLLTEKIQRGKNWVNIPKTHIEDPKKLSFIVEISSIPKGFDFKTRYGTKFEYKYPSQKKLTSLAESHPEAVYELRTAIQEHLADLEGCLKGRNFADPVADYSSKIDVASFVDYIIVQEVFKNSDGFTRSAYLYKAHGEKIHMGPLWDFDIALGNLAFLGFGKPKGWVYNSKFFTFKSVFWFKRLMSDPAFAAKVRQRYTYLRAGILSDANLLGQIKSLSLELEAAAARDRQRWHKSHNLVTKYFMNTPQRSKSFDDSIDFMKSWLMQRLQWIDKQWLLEGEPRDLREARSGSARSGKTS